LFFAAEAMKEMNKTFFEKKYLTHRSFPARSSQLTRCGVSPSTISSIF
jgi:hypothetical protein